MIMIMVMMIMTMLACLEAELLELVEGQIVKERDCAISDQKMKMNDHLSN